MARSALFGLFLLAVLVIATPRPAFQATPTDGTVLSRQGDASVSPSSRTSGARTGASRPSLQPSPSSKSVHDAAGVTASGALGSKAAGSPSAVRSATASKKPLATVRPTAKSSKAPQRVVRKPPAVQSKYGVPWLTAQGIASHMGSGFPPSYLALPHGPGWRARICGAGGCVTMTSNDAGPALYLQRQGRVADLSVAVFERVCGVPASMGLCPVTVTILGHV